MTTKEIIKKCFKKAAVPEDDRHKHLFELLCERIDDRFEKMKKDFEFAGIEDLILNESFILRFDEYEIEAADFTYGQKQDKYFKVTHDFKRDVEFKTVKSAIKYIEKQYQ
jgi:hypothetical protein